MPTPRPLFGGTLATASGFIFTGEPIDAATGEALWIYQIEAHLGGPAMSCAVNGSQFIAVAVGAPGAGTSHFGMIRAFVLPEP